MIAFWVELSRENPELARVELAAVVADLGGRPVPPVGRETPGALVAIALPDPGAAQDLARRLALARRVLRPFPPSAVREGSWAEPHDPAGRSAAFRPIGPRASGDAPELRDALVDVWKQAGGTLCLGAPERRFWYDPAGPGLAEEVAVVPRERFQARRMPKLPFRRPVALAPKLARVAANLARAAPGRRIVDPFIGTGALLAEAALLGAEVAGVDRSAEMIRGALENFRFLGLEASRVRVGDAGEAFPPEPGGAWDAILTDPPYGRASSTGGEPVPELLARTMRAWTPYVRPGGHLSLVVPAGEGEPVGPGWTRLGAVPDRVHRSLTREFRVYRRSGTGPVS